MTFKSALLGSVALAFLGSAPAFAQLGQSPPGEMLGNPGAVEAPVTSAPLEVYLDRNFGSTAGIILERGADGHWHGVVPSGDCTFSPTGLIGCTGTGGALFSAIATSGSASDLTLGTLPCPRAAALSGDVTSSAGSCATTLTGVNSNIGTFGSAAAIPILTVNAKGLVTAASTTPLSLTGDVTSTGLATTLATVNSNVGAFGSSTAIPSLTVNAKGLVTAASTNPVVAPAGTLTGATLAGGVTGSSLTSVGTLTGGSTGAGFTIALSVATVTGTLPTSAMPSLTGDVTSTGLATTVGKINGVALGSTTATAGNLMIGSGTQWVSAAMSGDVTIGSTGVTAIGANKVTRADQAQGIARSVIGVTGNATANVADIQGAANQVLVIDSAGTSVAFGAVNLASAAAVTGALPPAKGGTGTATAFTAGSAVFAGASGVYTQDNANFFWDVTNHRLGIGTTAPFSALSAGAPGAVPSLSTDSGSIATFMASNVGQILQIGALGATPYTMWIQAKFDAQSTAYPLAINPLGGNVAIGTISSPLATFDVKAATNGHFIFYAGSQMGTPTGIFQFTNDLANANNPLLITASAIGLNSGLVGVGTPNPNYALSVSQNATQLQAGSPAGTVAQFGAADGAQTRVLIDSYAQNNLLTFRRADGTAAAPSALLNNEQIGGVAWFGYGTNAYSISSRGYILGIAAENWSNTAQGLYLTFGTTPKTTAGPAERMRIDDAGNVGIGTNAPANILDIGTGGGIHITNGIPTSTAAALYNNGGALTWNGAALAQGSSVPWVDVKSGTNGCAAAIGNNVADDTTAIQCQLTWIFTNRNGGVLFFPTGSYKVTAQLTSKGVILEGAGRGVSSLNANTDISVLDFPNPVGYGGLRNISVYGYQNAAATLNVVTVEQNIPIIFEDCNIWGGASAVYEKGVDGYIADCFISGAGTSGYAVLSQGANWYERVKLDSAFGWATAGAFSQGISLTGGVAENHFTDSDFSGTYSFSVNINDSNNTSAMTVFEGGVFSAPISISNAFSTIFVGAELGSNSLVANSTGPLIISGSYGFSAITATGSAPRRCAAINNITC